MLKYKRTVASIPESMSIEAGACSCNKAKLEPETISTEAKSFQ